MPASSILWRRLDRPGHEAARVLASEGGWQLTGTAVIAHAGAGCRLGYRIDCDAAWRTRAARVDGWIGERSVGLSIEADARGWRLDGEPCPGVEGCVDLDLNFSPATNLLPIRRLALAVGARAEVRAAWLRFPGLTLEPLEQVYERLGPERYRYESAGGRFTCELVVNAAGLVTHYPGLAEPGV